MVDTVEALVDGGRASAGPPLGPALGPKGVNIGQVIAKINEKTKAFEGMKVPVKILINDDKSFDIKVGTPPMSALIKGELGVESGAHNAKTEKVGNLTLEQAKKIATMKHREGRKPDTRAGQEDRHHEAGRSPRSRPEGEGPGGRRKLRLRRSHHRRKEPQGLHQGGQGRRVRRPVLNKTTKGEGNLPHHIILLRSLSCWPVP